MDVKKIESQISDKQKSLGIIRNDIAEKKADLDEKRAAYSRGLLTNADSQEKPASLADQRDRVTKSQVELEGLRGVETLLLKEIKACERELKLAELFKTEAETFNRSMVGCEDAATRMADVGKSLAKNIRDFTKAAGVLFENSESAVSAFASVYGTLDRGLSLETFMKNGEMVEIEIEDHEEVLLLAGKNLQKFSFMPDAFDTSLVKSLLSCVRELTEWRRTIATYDPPGALMLTRKTLRPVKSKAFLIDGETQRAHLITQEDVKKKADAKRLHMEKSREQVPTQAPIRKAM